MCSSSKETQISTKKIISLVWTHDYDQIDFFTEYW